jgi:hypothetical protein
LLEELERFVAVLGLVYELPYLPDDNVRREIDLLHFAMVDNAFSFTTGMMHKNGECTLDIVYYGDTYIRHKNLIKQTRVLPNPPPKPKGYEQIQNICPRKSCFL